jgi:hypothetical protein
MFFIGLSYAAGGKTPGSSPGRIALPQGFAWGRILD